MHIISLNIVQVIDINNKKLWKQYYELFQLLKVYYFRV